MACNPNHLLIELGVSRRKLGHFVMGKEGTMKSEPTIEGLTAGDLRVLKGMISETHRKRMAGIDEVKRLRAVNVKLIEALEQAVAIVKQAKEPRMGRFWLPNFLAGARYAIEEAKK